MTSLVPLHQAPAGAVEDLLDAAFGRDRHGRTAYRLRAGSDPIAALSFAAFDEDDASLVGSLQSWPVDLVEPDGARHPLVLVGPVAVRPGLQRAGIGRAMMDRMLAAADRPLTGHSAAPALVLIGDPEYYGRFFGFSAAATGGWSLPGPFEARRLLARIRAGTMLPTMGLLAPPADFAAGRLIA